jgi:hypothetical protein
MGANRNAYRILMGTQEGNRLLGRQRRSWVDNIKVDLREIRRDDVDWIGLAEGPVEGSCEHGNETSGSIKY